MKPLGRKAYGSIPHLPNSRMGPADHSCHPGQQDICCRKARDRHDRVIVTEKLDGSCMSVAKINGEIVALGRSGYLAASSPFSHLVEFETFVRKNEARFDLALQEGQRFVGEWLNVSTGTIYSLRHEPFVIFDLMSGDKREAFDTMASATDISGFWIPHVISDGLPISVDDALSRLGDFGRHGAVEIVEGAVWRVERKGEFDFMAKFVRHEKIDGKYLPGLHGNDSYTRNTVVGIVP
jgi:RNA ligase